MTAFLIYWGGICKNWLRQIKQAKGTVKIVKETNKAIFLETPEEKNKEAKPKEEKQIIISGKAKKVFKNEKKKLKNLPWKKIKQAKVQANKENTKAKQTPTNKELKSGFKKEIEK